LAGFVWLGLIGAAFTYWLWFRGVARLEPSAVSMLGMMSPVTAVVLGWLWLGQTLSTVQLIGAVVVLGAVWVGQRVATGTAPTRRKETLVSARLMQEQTDG
jgi:probable blue pigment (indigoidine) exporter